MTDDGFWVNRIVETGAADPEELAKGFNPLNWRGHPEGQREALEEALDSIGFLQRVLVNRLTGRVIDGHLRIELAILKGQPLIPVDYVELTEDEEALALATLDAITEQAEPIADKLAALLARTREMTADRPGLRAMLDGLRERAGVNGNGHAANDATPQIDKAAELAVKWGTVVGQVWELGAHRLACGDCTDRAVVEAVMQGERADCFIGDPPYGVNLDTDFSGIPGSIPNKGGGKNKYPPIIGDSQDFDPTSLLEIFNYIDEQFWWGADYYRCRIPRGGSWLVWDKTITETLDKSIGSNFELCWSKTPHKRDILRVKWSGFYGIETQDKKVRFHPTQKPIEVMQWILERHCKDIAIDPYLGSGTTLIACEQIGRRCRAVEIDPGYVAVTLQRYADLTGAQPRLIAGG